MERHSRKAGCDSGPLADAPFSSVRSVYGTQARTPRSILGRAFYAKPQDATAGDAGSAGMATASRGAGAEDDRFTLPAEPFKHLWSRK